MITIQLTSHQKLRLQRTTLALLGGLLHTLVCFALWAEGMFRTSLQTFILLFSFLWIVQLSFPLLIFTNRNLKFKDPSLTLLEILWSQISVMISIYFVEDLRPLLLLFSLFSIVFGGFQLNFRQLLTVTLVSILLYICTIGLLATHHPEFINWVKEIIIAITYMLLMLSLAVIMSELNKTREQLQKKKMELQSSLLITQNDIDIDVLTGVKNRRYILEILAQQRAMVERHREYCVSLMILDLDQYSHLQENFGQSIADKALQAFVKMLSGQLRKSDYLARIGEEAFLLVGPFTRKDLVIHYADRVMNILKNTSLDHIMSNLRITCSVGITDYQWPEPIEETLARANKALTLAKSKGGNCSEIS